LNISVLTDIHVLSNDGQYWKQTLIEPQKNGSYCSLYLVFTTWILKQLNVIVDIHLKVAVYESNERAGQGKSVSLSDGTVHVGPWQSTGEGGEQQGHDELLTNVTDVKRLA
jgi:hypothetical protein